MDDLISLIHSKTSEGAEGLKSLQAELDAKHDQLKIMATSPNGGLLQVVSAAMDSQEHSLGVLNLL